MLVVLSPSKTMNMECDSLPECTQPDFIQDSQILNNELKTFSSEQIGTFMQISEKLSNNVCSYVRNWNPPFSDSNAKPALFAFSGDVYEGLDAASLSKEEIAFAQTNLRILSGLYGLLEPCNYIQPYRLEMGRSLETERGKNLYQFWGSRITDKINDAEQEVLINLASNEYFKAVKKKELQAKIVTPVFKDTSKGVLKVISFYAKKARGMMARYIIENRISDVEDLKKFDTGGYAFSTELSSEKELVFTR